MKEDNIKVTWLETRKMTRQGGSLYISIPKDFCDRNGIIESTPLDIYTTNEGDVIILKKKNTSFKEN